MYHVPLAPECCAYTTCRIVHYFAVSALIGRHILHNNKHRVRRGLLLQLWRLLSSIDEFCVVVVCACVYIVALLLILSIPRTCVLHIIITIIVAPHLGQITIKIII